MWFKIANIILKNKILLLVIILGLTAFFGYKTKDVQMSYTFTNAIPTDNPKYKDYNNFVKTFGADGNTLMIGIQTDKFFDSAVFNNYISFTESIAAIPEVTAVLSTNKAIYLKTDSVTKLAAMPLFNLEAA